MSLLIYGNHELFDSHIAEYNDFLKIANKFYDLNVSKTFLLFHRKTNELLAYMTFSADSIKLTQGLLWDVQAVLLSSCLNCGGSLG